MCVTQRATHMRMLLEWIHTWVRTRMLLACRLRVVVDRAFEGLTYVVLHNDTISSQGAYLSGRLLSMSGCGNKDSYIT